MRLAKVFAISVPAGIIAFVMVAVVVEAWTRFTWDPLKGTPGFFLSDPARIQRLAPGYSGWFAGVPVHINQLELRDNREYRLAKDRRTFRILFLGDSVTFGHGSVYEHTYPYLLERRLRDWRADVDWQVWNAAVPGYNTSQELAHLLEVGPKFQPDLVVVGFFENDVVDNFPVAEPGPVARLFSATMTFLYRHVYSTELYKRVYLDLAWRLSASNSYRLRLEHVATEEQLTANVGQIQDLKGQQLTPFERRSDEQMASVNCPDGPRMSSDLVASIQRERGWHDWIAAVRRFQQMSRDDVYPVVFFLNTVPLACQNPDVFYDGGSGDVNRFYLKILAEGTPAVSTYDEFLHLRPSEVPMADAHAIGNSNLVKADVLFRYLRDQVFPHLTGGRSAAILQRPQAP